MVESVCVDSHCHLDMFDDLEAVMDRAREAGVERMLTISTSLKEEATLLEICRRYSGRVAMTLGVHPEVASEVADDEIREAFQKIPLCDEILGVGEIGLDYHQNPDDEERARQKEVFRLQLELASGVGVPVSLHTRAAAKDTLEIVREFQGQKIVFHCFGESKEVARQVLDLGFYISFSGIVTFKNAKGVQEVARFVPLDRTLVETDAPFLAPDPMRGQRNEPAFVRHTAEFLAHLRGIAFEDLCATTTRNFEAVFGGGVLCR